MKPTSMVSRPVAAILLLALAAGGCSGGDADTGRVEASGDGMASDTAGLPVDTGATSDAAAADTASDVDGEDPFHGFDLPSSGEPRSEARVARLLLSNASEEPAVVYGDGGAGEVLLDTVPPESDRRVDVTTRAMRLGVRSVTTAGVTLRQEEITVGADSVVEIPVGRVPPAP